MERSWKQAFSTNEFKVWYHELFSSGNVASCPDCGTNFNNTSGQSFFCTVCYSSRAASKVVWSKGLPAVVPTSKRAKQTDRDQKQPALLSPKTTTPAVSSVLFRKLTCDDLKHNKPLHLTELPDVTNLLALVDESCSRATLSKIAKTELETLLASTGGDFLQANGPLDTLRYLPTQESAREYVYFLSSKATEERTRREEEGGKPRAKRGRE